MVTLNGPQFILGQGHHFSTTFFSKGYLYIDGTCGGEEYVSNGEVYYGYEQTTSAVNFAKTFGTQPGTGSDHLGRGATSEVLIWTLAGPTLRHMCVGYQGTNSSNLVSQIYHGPATLHEFKCVGVLGQS